MAEIEALSDRIDALSEGSERWNPEDMAPAGAVIGIGHGGKLSVERGLVRAEDEAAAGNRHGKTGKAASTADGPSARTGSPTGWSRI